MIQATFGFTSGGELALVLGGAASLAVVITEAPWGGVAADRYGERRVLILGVSLCALLLLIVGISFATKQAPSVPILLILLFLAAGAGGAVTGPSGSAILGWFDTRRHGTLVSLRVAAVPLGGAIGTAAYSVLLSRFGIAATFIVVGLSCAAVGVLVAVYVYDPPIAARAVTLRSGARALRRLDVWRVASSGFLLDVTQFLVLTFSATALTRLFGLPLVLGLIAVAAMQIIGALLRVLTGVGTDLLPWLNRPTVVRVLCATQVACLLPFVFGTSLPEYVGVTLMIVSGVAGCAWQGAHFAQITSLVDRSEAGSALGLNNAATSFGAFVAQIAAGLFATLLGWPTAILVLGALPALLALMIFPPGGGELRNRSSRRQNRMSGVTACVPE